MVDWNGFKKNGTAYIPNDATARAGVIANTKLIKDTVGWSGKNKNGTKYVTGESNSVNWVANADGSITAVSGTATGDNAQNGLANPFTAKYTGQVLLTGGYDSHIYLFHYDVTDSARPYTDSTKTTRSSANQYGDTPLSFYMEAGHKYSIVARVVQGNAANNTTMYPMLRDADILDDTYEPYFGSTAFPRSEQAVLGAKNLLQNTGVSGTSSGVSFVVNADKSVACSNTASGGNGQFTVNADLSYLPKNTPLILSGFPSTGTASKRMFIRWTDGGNTVYKVDQGEGVTFSIPSTATNIVCLIVYSDGQTANETVYPMIRLATDPDDTYVPYAMTNRELTEKVQWNETVVSVAQGIIANGNKVIRTGNVVEVYLTIPMQDVSSADKVVGILPFKPANIYAFIDIFNNTKPYETICKALIRPNSKELVIPQGAQTSATNIFITGTYVCTD